VSEAVESVTLDRLLSCLRVHLPDLAVRFQIASLGVFGSYLRGEQRPDSDLDMLVDFHEPPGLFDFIRLENELSALLGVKVDLVLKSALKPGIGRYVLEEVQQV
jgi:predicted nucleotidyltransferase